MNKKTIEKLMNKKIEFNLLESQPRKPITLLELAKAIRELSRLGLSDGQISESLEIKPLYLISLIKNYQ